MARKGYPAEFRRRALDLVAAGKTVAEVARLLGLETRTVAGYIRSGRIPGRHDQAPTSLGWMTTRRAVEDYRTKLQKPVTSAGN